MTGGKQPQHGFTIVETLIVLAVTGLIFLSAALLIAGQVNKTEFAQSVQDIQSRTQQRINEVINGFYPNNNDIKCSPTPSGPVITKVLGTSQGTNQDCIFVGKVMQFAVDTDSSHFNIYTIAGLRETTITSGVQSTDLGGVQPHLIAPGFKASSHKNFPPEYEQGELQFGLTAVHVYFNDDPTQHIGSIGFVSSFGSPGTNNDLISGAQHVNLYIFNNSTLNFPPDKEADLIDQDFGTLSGQETATAKLAKSVQVCFQSGTTSNEWALMNIGENQSNKTTVTIKVTNTDCS